MQHQNVNDNDLITGYLQGNETCLQTLIGRHKVKIFTSILILVKRRALAEDLFQETFIRIIKTLREGKYREEGKFLPWAIRIAHNITIDYFRVENRMKMVRDTEEYCIMDSIIIPEDNAEDKMVKERVYGQVRLLIEELPFELREVLIMRYYGEMSFKDIAECTNASLGRMRYALQHMRKLVKNKHLDLAV
jgi:RNA polymerase sigma factor (sigma-70 family)